MDSLKSLLPKVLRKRGLHAQAEASLVVHLANQWLTETVGPLAETLRAKTYEQGSLIIAAESSVAAQEMAQLESRLIETLQRQGHSIDNITIVRR